MKSSTKSKHSKTAVFFFFLMVTSIISFGVQAQSQEPVFPEQEGQELINSLISTFKPGQSGVLSYDDARDLLYSSIYNVNDTVSCVYSGYQAYLPPNTADPSAYFWMGGNENAITTEHTFPQSKGAGEGNARSDMHHLFPARFKVNEVRSNYAFSEIPDEETWRWYFKQYEFNNMPSYNIENFSELNWQLFEPREDHKGNVARAMFYFYTMYKTQADAADPEFFEKQRETLCGWHTLDPVDELEWSRTYHIADYQEGKPNPFVIDHTLAKRVYCQDAVVSSVDHEKPFRGSLTIAPNPVSNQSAVMITVDQPTTLNYTIFNALGQAVVSNKIDLPIGSSAVPLTLDTDVYRASFYIFQAHLIQGNESFNLSEKLIAQAYY